MSPSLRLFSALLALSIHNAVVAAPSDLYLSEYIEGSGNNKALELYNPTDKAIDLSLYQLTLFSNGRGFAEGAKQTLDLEGTLAAKSTYVIAHSSASIEVKDKADIIDEITNFNGDDAIVLRKKGVVIDSFGRVGEDPGSAWSENGVSTKDQTLRRKASISSGDTNPEDAFDPSIEWDGFEKDNFVNLGSIANEDVIEPNLTPIAITIPQIQGEGMESPYKDKQVSTNGVVTGLAANGFYLQDMQGDNNPKTSDGIFVYTKDTPMVKVGDSVTVKGKVAEYYEQTQISSANNQVIVGAVNQTIMPTPLVLPMSDAAQWEQYEGMLIKAENLVVAETYQLARYGQIVLAPVRLWTPTQVTTPGESANALAKRNALSRLMLDDGSDVQNPDPVQYAGFGALSYANPIRSGYTLPTLQGVVRYSYGNYMVVPVADIAFTATNDRKANAEPASVGGNIKVANFNVLNYFTTLADGKNKCGPQLNQDCRGANAAEELTRQKAKIVRALSAIKADVFGLIEIENNPSESLRSLVDALNAESGSTQYAYVDAGTVGTDAIKSALIYRTDSVELVGGFKTLDYQDQKNRTALIQTFQPKGNKNSELQFTVVVNHLKSKGSDCDNMPYVINGETVMDKDKKDGQGNCNLTRQAAVKKLVAYLKSNPTKASSDQVLLIGDFNSYAMEDPITSLQQAGYSNLVNNLTYSYLFDGQLGTLDYAFANASLAKHVTSATIWHINADEPAGFDYDMTYKKDAQDASYYADTAFRSSDHDPVIVGLNLKTSITPDPDKPVTPDSGNSSSGGGALGVGGLLLSLMALLGFVTLRRRT